MRRMLLVFGSINLDLAFSARSLPLAGQTVLGTGMHASPGGKGANQAHAAQRYGMVTALVGAVGNDDFARLALAQLVSARVDLSGLQRLAGATGCAALVVDAAGQNQIVVAPGVNLELRHDAVTAQQLSRARAVLLQMETDPAQNPALLARARQLGCLTALNNAPAQALSPDMLGALNVLVVNEGELQATAQGAGLPAGAPAALLRAISVLGPARVDLTLGAAGALACDHGAMLQVDAMAVRALDTTGAGDTFTGVLIAALVEGRTMADALSRASIAAGLACTRPGAQTAQPDRVEIEAALP